MDKDIKHIWKSVNAQTSLMDEDIDDIIKQKSTSVLDKIKRSLKREFKMTCLTYSLAIIAFLYFKIYTGASLFFGAFVAMIFYYFKLKSKLDLNAITLTNYEYLKISYQRLKEYMRYYKIFGIIFLISSFFLGLEYGGFFENLSAFIEKINNLKVLIYFFLLIIIFAVFVFGFIKYINHKHAKRLKDLKTLLNDLEASN